MLVIEPSTGMMAQEPTLEPETGTVRTVFPDTEVLVRVAADVWEKDVWEFQAKSGSSGSCRLFLHFLGKIAVQELSGKTPGSPRHPSSRHPRPSD